MRRTTRGADVRVRASRTDAALAVSGHAVATWSANRMVEATAETVADAQASGAVKVLVVEDLPSDAELMIHALRKVGLMPNWTRVDTLEEAARRLGDDLDLVLLDYELPGFTGMEVLALRRQRGLRVPAIMVTGVLGEESAAEAVRAGAADYVVKDRMARLGASALRAIDERRQQALQEAREVEAERRLREAEERFRTALDAMLGSVAIFSPVRDDDGTLVDLRYVYVNQAACETYGLTRSEVVGRTMRGLFPEVAGRDGFFDAYREVVRTGVPLAVAVRGHARRAGISRRPDADTFDVRAARLAEGLVVAFRHLPAPPGGAVARASPSPDRRAATVRASDLEERISEHRTKLDAMLQELATGAPVRAEVLLSALEELSVGLEELEVSAEELTAFTDEAAHMRGEDEAVRLRYQRLFDRAPDANLVTDRHGVILELNTAARRLLDGGHVDPLRKPVVSYVAREDHRRLYACLRSVTTTPGHAVEWTTRLASRRRPSVSVAARCVADDDPADPTLHWSLRESAPPTGGS